MRRRLPRPALPSLGQARTSFSRGDRPAAAALEQLGTLYPALAAATTHLHASLHLVISFFLLNPPVGGASLYFAHPLHCLFSSRSPPLPSLLCAFFFSHPSSFLFIHIYLAPVFSLLLSFPHPLSGSLLYPRSGASGAPPLARRDVARGDVDADVSGALDVCLQPGPGLQGRRRPLRRLLEQQQP